MRPGSRLNLVQLSTLRELQRRGTLAAAADHLGYTAGAVSQHVASLEAMLGVALVERSGRHLVLTDAGRVMAEHAEELLDAESRAVSATRFAHSAVAGPLVVGTWGSTAAGLLAPVVQRMAARFPEVRIRSCEVDLDEASTSVRDGQVDVAFGLDYADAPIPRDPSMHLVRLQPESFAVVVAPTLVAGLAEGPPGAHRSRHRHRGVDVVDAVEVRVLADLDWILPPESSQYGRAIRAGFRRLGFEPRVVHEVTDTAASLQLAAAGLGATVMTALMRRLNPSLDLTSLRLPEQLTRQIVLFSRGDTTQRQPVRAFIEQSSILVDELLETLER
jgi:DNA-binding transcriptional LysR family regulator